MKISDINKVFDYIKRECNRTDLDVVSFTIKENGSMDIILSGYFSMQIDKDAINKALSE